MVGLYFPRCVHQDARCGPFRVGGRQMVALWVCTAFLVKTAAAAGALSVQDAVDLALASDPTIHELRAEAAALRERAVSRAQLPDPSLKLGAAALPIDSFDLDQEPMTQLQLGLRQQFLPGRTLQLRGEQAMFSAEAIDSMIRAHQLSISRAVRDTFVEIQYRLRGEAILENARAVLAEMTGVVRDYYANGRAQQHDVLLADLEVTRLDDRLLRMQQAQQEARARLSQWIGAKAYDSVDTQWSDMAAVAPREQLFGDLGKHPQLQAGRRRIHAAETAVDIAREQYKPGWAVELTYGDRSGNAADGRARSDFLFASVTVDLPLFRDSRQDRSLSAAALELDAETARVADHRRRLARDLEQSLATLSALTSRIALYEDQLIPQAKESSEAALAAYQSDVSDFSTLLRAQLIEFELQLDLARAEADRRQIVATVDYLTGDKQ